MNDEKKSGILSFLIVISVTVIISVVLLIRFFLTGRNNTPVPDSEPVAPKPTETIVTLDVSSLNERLQDTGVLITQEYCATQVATYTKEASFLHFFTTESQFIYSYDVTVSAGVDFSEITVDVNEKTKVVSVTMPDSEIYSTDIDTESFQMYSEKDHLWNRLTLDDYNVSLNGLESDAEDKAIESGILNRADSQAELLLKNFILSLPNANDYTIEFL